MHSFVGTVLIEITNVSSQLVLPYVLLVAMFFLNLLFLGFAYDWKYNTFRKAPYPSLEIMFGVSISTIYGFIFLKFGLLGIIGLIPAGMFLLGVAGI